MSYTKLQRRHTIEQARTLLEDDKFLHAAQLYHRLIHDDPSYATAYLELATLHVDHGNLQAGIDLLREADARIPNHIEIQLLLGDLYLRGEEYEKALAYYKRFSREKLPHVHFNMGVAYYFKNNIKQAEEQFRLTLKLDAHFPKINESLGEILLQRGVPAESIKYLKKGVTSNPRNPVNHYLLGVAYSQLMDWKNSHKEFLIAIEMDPTEPSYWHMCGESLLRLKRYDEAEFHIRKALELHPQSVDALILLGQLHALRGDVKHASEWIEQALTLDPKNARAKEVQWNLRDRAT